MAAILFDLDGTLIDSAADIRSAVNAIFTEAGTAPFSQEEITSFVGNGLPTLVERAMQAREIAAEHHGDLLAAVSEAYAAAPADLTQPYPGVLAALDDLLTDGHKLGIATNKPEAPARAILEVLGLSGAFDVVIGGDTLPQRKPDPAPLLHGFGALGEGPRVFVGDSEVDAGAAAAAGVRFLLFTEGYRKSPVEEIAHDVAFSDYADLPGLMT